MSDLEQQRAKNRNTHSGYADYSSDNWEERVADVEEEKPIFEFPRRKGSKIPAGQGNDFISIILGGVFAAAVISTGWFVVYSNNLLRTPWAAVLLAAATLFGVKAASDGNQRMDTGVALVVYIVALVAVVSLLTNQSSAALQNEGFSLQLFETELTRIHVKNTDNSYKYLGGLVLIIVFGFFSRRPPQYRS